MQLMSIHLQSANSQFQFELVSFRLNQVNLPEWEAIKNYISLNLTCIQ